ncbi:MAG: hypothetical protein ACYTGR_03385 [Planctomycetota bacterium]|jgi:hypothetical protein
MGAIGIGLGLIGLLFVLTPIIVGIWLIVRGIRGRLLLAEPHCATCNHDLRRTDGVHARCPECGASLSDGQGVSFGRSRRHPRLIIAGVLVMVIGPAVFLLAARMVLLATQRTVQGVAGMTGGGTNPALLQAMTDDEVLAALAADWDAPWVWQEIDGRHMGGALTDEQVDQAVRRALDAVDSAPVEASDPLTWGDGERQRWIDAGVLAESTVKRLRLLQVGVRIQMPYRVHEGETVDFRISTMPGRTNQSALIAIESLRVEGTPLPVTFEVPSSGRRAGSAPGVAGPQVPVAGTFTIALAPGEYELAVMGDIGVLDAVDAQVMAREPTPARDAWPDRLEVGRRTFVRPLTVVPAGEPIMALVGKTESLRAAIRRLMQPEGVAAQDLGDGSVNLSLVAPSQRGQPPVPLVFTAKIVVDEKSWKFFTIALDQGSTSRSGSDQLPVADFDRDIETVTVIFEPDLEYARRYPTLSNRAIWGEPVVFENMKVRWY